MPHNSLMPVASVASPTLGGELFPGQQVSLEVVAVEDPATRDERLNHAVAMLIPAALERKQGILVIRHDHGRYTVRLDQEVPCGVTQESRGKPSS